MNNRPPLYGLIGYPIGHSRSPELFRLYSPLRAVAEYRLFPLEHLDDLEQLIREQGPRGLNVTAPYKEAILSHFPEVRLSPEVACLGAANVLALDYDETGLVRCSAYNTDVYGFAESLRELLAGQRPPAIILGTGGAARAVALGLEQLGYGTSDYCMLSRRSAEPSPQLQSFVADRDIRLLPYRALEGLLSEPALIINASPVGIESADELPLPYEVLNSAYLCYDLNYREEPTAFLRRCAQMGARSTDGARMLRLQAEASWRIWSEHLQV